MRSRLINRCWTFKVKDGALRTDPKGFFKKIISLNMADIINELGDILRFNSSIYYGSCILTSLLKMETVSLRGLLYLTLINLKEIFSISVDIQWFSFRTSLLRYRV